MSENKYPIGGYAPGNYQHKCCTCGQPFTGDKRAVECEPCAIKGKEQFDSLPDWKQNEIRERNVRIANYMFSGQRTPERELIYRIVEQWGNAVEMPNMEGWLRDYAAVKQTGAAWLSGSPKERKQHFAKVKSKLIDECIYHAVIWPVSNTDHWWAIGEGFKFTVHKDEIIAYLDESAIAPSTRWITGQYDKLYDQVKGGKRTVCWVDYYGGYDPANTPPMRDICSIHPDGMEFLARGISYGCPRPYIVHQGMSEKEAFIRLCEEKNVEWLCEGEAEETSWISADIKPEHNVGVLVFIPGEDNHITSGMWDISNEWVLLDEYRTPEEEVTHWMPMPAFPDGYTWNEIPNELVAAIKRVAEEEVGKFPLVIPPRMEEDAMSFAEWAAIIAFFDDGTRLWELIGEGQAINGQFRFTTKEFYQLFKQQKEKR